MADKTGIEWTDATWNPVTGCAKVSQGCKHCYAEREWPRMTKLVPAYAGRDFTDVRTHGDRLDQPLRWRRPRRIFVNSMSDLFHDDVDNEFIAAVFAVMGAAEQHTFQVLTKRPERMRSWFKWIEQREHHFGHPGDAAREIAESFGLPHDNVPYRTWPLPNVWLGVSVEDQAAADERIPLLLDTPAAVRWISAEPLLGPVDLNRILVNRERGFHASALHEQHDDCYYQSNAQLDWVVVGGESGPKSRPMRPQWARDLRDQCAAAGVPFLFKQWGEWFPTSIGQGGSQLGAWNGDDFMPGWGDIKNPENNMVRAGKRAFGGRLLDGVQHDGYPTEKP